MIRTNKGFTLIELMVVIVIIGVLAALAIPKFTSASDKAKWSEAPTVLSAYENAQLAHIAEKSARGALADLSFTTDSVSNWFAYTSPSLGSFQAAVRSGMTVGGIGAGGGIMTTIDSLSAISHTRLSGTDSTKIAKMVPNFFKN